MGTYTSNYNLFMPSVGETGWGTLVNTNFSTIDTTMKSLSNRIAAVENEVNGNLSCTSVTATTGTFSGAVTGASFNGIKIKTKYTVTPNTNVWIPLPTSDGSMSPVVFFPFSGGNITYSGSITLKNSRTNGSSTAIVGTSAEDYESYSVPANGTLNVSFTNISYLSVTGYASYVSCSGYTLS